MSPTTPNAPRSERRGRLVLLAALATAIACLAVLVLFELGLRLLRGNDFFFPYHPNSVQVFYPNAEITPGVSGVSYFTANSYGTRGPELADERIRILVIGGSTTACTLLDDGETWPALLMAELNRERPGEVWVTNSGIDGKNSDHHRMHAQYLVPRLPRLDFVIVYAGLNDLGLWLYREVYDPDFLDNPDNWDSRVGESFRLSSYTPASEPVYKRLHLWKLASQLKATAKSMLLARERQAGGIVQDENLEWLQEEQEARRERRKEFVHRAKMETLPQLQGAYRQNLREIVRLVRARGTEPVFVAQAMAGQLKSDEERERLWMGAMDGGKNYVKQSQMVELVETLNRDMQEVAQEEGVLFIDLPGALADQDGLYYDLVHFNEHGASVVARAIAEALGDAIVSLRADSAHEGP